MSKKIYVVNTEAGLHTRPAGLLVKTIGGYDVDATVTKGDATLSAKSIIGLLSLAARKGDELTIEFTGPDELVAMEEVTKIFDNNFGE